MKKPKSKKKVAESLPRISIFQLNQDGFLEPGTHEAVIGWLQSADEVPMATHMETTGSGYLNLRYFTLKGVDYDAWVRIVSTPCRYGGLRYWFQCPDGERRLGGDKPEHRAAVLYFNGEQFVCRACCDVTYASRRERFSGVQVSDLDTFDTRHMNYNGKLTRKFKRVMKQRKKAMAKVDWMLWIAEKFNQRPLK